LRKIISCSAFLALSACGINSLNIEKSRDDGSGQTPLKPITIPVQMLNMSGVFQLADATTFSIVMEGCISGYSTTVDETSGGLTAYKFDQGCLAKLKEFEVGGIIYSSSNAGATDFTTWLAGDSATFTDASGSSSIGVTVGSQLDSPITGTEPISYAFSTALEGVGDNVTEATVGASHTVTVAGDAAPDVEIFSNDFVGMTATGAGQFSFALECQSGAISGNFCAGSDMTAWSWALVEDTFAGTPTLDDLNAMVMDATSGTVNGTINTNGGVDTPVLQGPDQIHLKPNMLFVIKNGASYKYFNVDVSVLPLVQ
jgi:hypothetical protein